MDSNDTVVLRGSEREAVAGARVLGPVDPAAPVTVTVLVRRRADLPPEVRRGEQRLGIDELRERHGADPADVDRVGAALRGAGATVVEQDPGSRRVVVSATAGQLSALFGTTLIEVESPSPTTGRPVRHRQRTGSLHVPRDLDGVITAVLGLDDRPQARPHVRVAAPEAVASSFTPVQVSDLYDFPPAADGSGQSVAVIELGGGIATSDLSAYFGALGLGVPTVSSVGVDGGANSPGQDPDADGEVALDVEVIGAAAPGAAQTVYFAPNTDAGFHDALADALHATPTPVAISISWGESEDSWTAQGRTALDEACADAAAVGVTVTVAAGDHGSSDGVTDGKPHVDFPASSPYVLACGGTTLKADPSSGIEAETVWNDGAKGGSTGGGVSDVFPVPAWQTSAGVPANAATGTPGRGVPDVAGDADPETGYVVRVDGAQQVIGGTSAVAPLWAALVARLAQALGHAVGPLQPALYAGVHAGSAAPGFNDITSGTNGAYHAGVGWDPCTGLGSPRGADILARLEASSSAGTATPRPPGAPASSTRVQPGDEW